MLIQCIICLNRENYRSNGGLIQNIYIDKRNLVLNHEARKPTLINFSINKSVGLLTKSVGLLRKTKNIFIKFLGVIPVIRYSIEISKCISHCLNLKFGRLLYTNQFVIEMCRH